MKGQSKYLKNKKSKIWDETFGRINPRLKGKYEECAGSWGKNRLYSSINSLEILRKQ